MKKNNVFIICVIIMATILIGCKKGIIDIGLPQNRSLVECTINGNKVRSGANDIVTELLNPLKSMYFYYNDKDTFTFQITRKAGIYIYVRFSSLPDIGRKYYFKEPTGNYTISPDVSQPDVCIAGIEVFPHLYELTDTLQLPPTLRKAQLTIMSNIPHNGSIEFSEIDLVNRNIFGKFEFDTEAISSVQGIQFNWSVKQGVFEGYHLTQKKTEYTLGFSEHITYK